MRVKGTLGAVALMVIGAVLGIAADRTLWHAHGAGEHAGMVASLQKDIDLDAEQMHAVQAIMQHHQERVDHAWAVVRPEVRAALDSIERQIAEVLRPDQRDRFHAWFERHHAQE